MTPTVGEHAYFYCKNKDETVSVISPRLGKKYLVKTDIKNDGWVGCTYSYKEVQKPQPFVTYHGIIIEVKEI